MSIIASDARDPRDTNSAPAQAISRLAAMCASIGSAAGADPAAVQAHLDDLTKPRGSLGRLEALALRLARIYGDPPPPLRRRVVFVFAADHGVASRGVSAYPAEVTAQMCRNFVAGGAAINAIARSSDAEVVAVDVGVDAPPDALAGVVARKVRRGTRDLSAGPAMTLAEAVEAIGVGHDLALDHANAADVLAVGEMGIGNTTAAAAVTAALTDRQPERVVGPGTGVDGERIDRKRRIIAEALARIPRDADALQVLAEVGGLEIAAMTGAILGSAHASRAVVVDGFIATSAALVAGRLCPAALDYVIASHRSTEPGHRVQLEALGLDPVLDLDLRLGEGTGAALALPIVEAAGAVLREMATFSAAGVSTESMP